mmetsp:Transcript_8695/g.17377  ORF Transcript_8695/g.17377 Transcript_8695/m.17377 type:complete len:101 (+) Transcript_8695:1247-1549(+)
MLLEFLRLSVPCAARSTGLRNGAKPQSINCRLEPSNAGWTNAKLDAEPTQFGALDEEVWIGGVLESTEPDKTTAVHKNSEPRRSNIAMNQNLSGQSDRMA